MLDGMHEIGNIHTFEDSTFLQSICRTSYAVLLAGTLGGVVLFLCGVPCELPAAIADIVRAVHESKAKIAELEAQRSAKDSAGAAVDVSAESEADFFCDDPADAKVEEPCESKSGE